MIELTSPSPPPAASGTVLVAEPDVLVRLLICHYLRECGYRVVEAANADEAVTILSSRDTRIDIVLCVVELTGAMDGFGLARWVRSRLPDIDVILAGSSTRTAQAAGKLCEEGLLYKPYDHKLLAERIKRLLAARGRK